MPPKHYTFEEHCAWFEDEHTKLILEPGTSVCGPYIDALTDRPEVAPWRTDFALIFSDKKYVRVVETFGETRQTFNGAGRRNHFAFHYGDCGALDSDGFPEQMDQVDLRVDRQSGHPDHIHYAGEDHVPHTRCPGIDFDEITAFDFIAAVLRHRKDGKKLHEILKFQVIPG